MWYEYLILHILFRHDLFIVTIIISVCQIIIKYALTMAKSFSLSRKKSRSRIPTLSEGGGGASKISGGAFYNSYESDNLSIIS